MSQNSFLLNWLILCGSLTAMDDLEPNRKRRKKTESEKKTESSSKELFELLAKSNDRPFQVRKLARLLKEGDVDVNEVQSEGEMV